MYINRYTFDGKTSKLFCRDANYYNFKVYVYFHYAICFINKHYIVGNIELTRCARRWRLILTIISMFILDPGCCSCNLRVLPIRTPRCILLRSPHQTNRIFSGSPRHLLLASKPSASGWP